MNYSQRKTIIFEFEFHRFQLTPDEAGFGLTQFHLKDTILSDTCYPEAICDETTIHSPFRTLDGSCNNIKHASWGKSRTQYQRILVPAYADGKDSVENPEFIIKYTSK